MDLDLFLSTAVFTARNERKLADFITSSFKVAFYVGMWYCTICDITASLCCTLPVVNVCDVSNLKFFTDAFSLHCCQMLIEHESRMEWNRLETYSRILILFI